MALIYTDEAAFTEYTSLDVLGWPDAATLLEQAQRIVDMALGNLSRDPTTGLKYTPSQLEPWRAEALSNAVCAQAEYMLVKGAEFFIEEVPLNPRGPDGSQDGREPILGPKANQELSYGQLYQLTGRSQVPFPNQNVDDYVS